MCETTNSRTQGSMHFVETMKMGANNKVLIQYSPNNLALYVVLRFSYVIASVSMILYIHSKHLHVS